MSTVPTNPTPHPTPVIVTREKQEAGATTFWTRFEPTPLEADWADEHLAGLDILVRNTTLTGEEGIVSIREASDGTWWRYAGSIRVRQHEDGAWRFTIYLYRGATMNDYLRLRSVVTAAQNGEFLRAGWRQRELQNGSTAWVYDAGHPSPAPDAQPQNRYDLVTVCTDSRCRMDVHDGPDFEHVADEVEGKRWEMVVSRMVSDDDEDDKFALWVNVEGDLSPAETAELGNDLLWLVESRDRVNATVPNADRKGWTKPKQVAA